MAWKKDFNRDDGKARWGFKAKDLQSMQKYAACYWAQTAWL